MKKNQSNKDDHSKDSRWKSGGTDFPGSVLSPEGVSRATTILNVLSAEWSEVQPGERLRQRAERLIRIHPLRTAEAFQLAAALIWAEESPKEQEIVCLDHNLREAAHKEGFTVFPEKF